MVKENGWRFKQVSGTSLLATLMRNKRPQSNKAWTENDLSFASGIAVATIRRFKAGYTGRRVNLEILLQTLGVSEDEYNSHIESVSQELTVAKQNPTPVLVADEEKVAQPPQVPALPPTPPGKMFGRDEAITNLRGLMTSNALPTILLTGWPGIGKTALSQATLWDEAVARHFGDHRYWVQGERANDATMLLTEIALAMGLPASSSEEVVQAALRARMPCVLAIDNLETPLHGDKTKCVALLRRLGADSGVALFASYRGEASGAGTFWQHRISVEELLEQPAMDLFASVAGVPAWATDERVRETVREVEQLPLAVVLLANLARGGPLDRFRRDWNAARIRLMSPDDEESRDGNWSVCLRFSLESPRLKNCPAALRLARILGQLPDGIAEVDMEALLPDDTDNALDALKSVGLMSYVEVSERYRMLHPIREYLNAYFPPEDITGDWKRIEAHYIDLLRKLGPKSGFDISHEARARLLAELNNLSGTLLHALEEPNPDEAMGVLPQYGKLIWSSNQGDMAPLIKGANLISREAFRQSAIECLFSIGEIYLRRFEYDLAKVQFDLALPLYREARNKVGQANCVQSIGDIHLRRSEFELAHAQFKQAMFLYDEAGDKIGQAKCRQRVGDIHLSKSEFDLARTQFNVALPLYEEAGNKVGQANCLRRIGDIHLKMSELDLAQLQYEVALPLYREAGNKVGQANCVRGIGDIHLRKSEFELAHAQFEQAMSLYDEAGDKVGQASVAQLYGIIALYGKDEEEARRKLQEAIRKQEEAESWQNVANSYYYLSFVPATPEVQEAYGNKADEIWSRSFTAEQIVELKKQSESYLPAWALQPA